MPVSSNPLPLGTRLPWFRLTALDGRDCAASDISSGRVAIMAFICNHSPYVRHIEDRLAEVLNMYQRQGVYVVAISPNDIVSYPSDSVDEMRLQADRGVPFEFPYCIDESQEVTKAFQVACTPELFVYDQSGRLAYHGQFDSSRPSAGNDAPVTGDSLAAAVSCVVDGEVLSSPQLPSLGCSVKWRSGNEPDYVLAIPDQRWIIDVA
jgi:peroxiredoxin